MFETAAAQGHREEGAQEKKGEEVLPLGGSGPQDQPGNVEGVTIKREKEGEEGQDLQSKEVTM